MDDDVAYVSSREAADLLGISLRTAQLWVENGVLVAWKTPGGHRRILLSSVQQVLAERSKITQPGIASAKLRVVVVEDDPDLSTLLKLTISQVNENVDVICAKDGFEGLVLIGQSHPDVVITDLNMPGMDGFRMIRAIGGGENAPRKIVVITALSPVDISQRGGLPDDIHVLEKPVSITSIESLIRSEYEVAARIVDPE